ncbi:hypothetical protein ACLMJV_30415 [Sinorhizobium meliloti]|uniref:hypothetical protein n=1 Tax=Rhizobium meliloti TaxID=382 RepID=UPI00398D6549
MHAEPLGNHDRMLLHLLRHHSNPIGEGLDGLTQWEVTIAETLSDAGYATGRFGKRHLGSAQRRLPNDQGFDE